MQRRHLWTALFLLGGSALTTVGAEIQLLPAVARLDGPKARQRFLVEAHDGHAFVGDRTGEARFTVGDPKVAAVSADGTVTPVGNGLTEVSATIDGQVARANISVENFERPTRWSFQNHVLSVLTKAGCNSGACHGAAAGKNGFRLTLRGYGPEVDFDVLTRQASGRRIVKTAPAESLLLLKPTGALEHGGGVKFSTDSLEYRVIAEWIAAGTPRPRADDPTIVSLAVVPESVLLKPAQAQQVLVQARFSDGHVEDVTRWAKFASTDDTVAKVDEQGKVKVEGHGEAAITVWYASRVQRTTVISPYEAKIDPTVFAAALRLNPIDEKNLAKLKALSIPPPPTPAMPHFSAAPRSTRPAPCPRPSRLRRSLPTPTRRSERSLSRDCWPARSLSTTGPTSGPTCSWSPRIRCRRRRCGPFIGSFARAWPTTSPGTSLPARL